MRGVARRMRGSRHPEQEASAWPIAGSLINVRHRRSQPVARLRLATGPHAEAPAVVADDFRFTGRAPMEPMTLAELTPLAPLPGASIELQ
jgi:hypothetical protein